MLYKDFGEVLDILRPGALRRILQGSRQQKSKGRKRRILRSYNLQSLGKGRKPWLGFEVVCSLLGRFSATKANATSTIFRAATVGREVFEM